MDKLANIRKSIEEIDYAILRLLKERIELSKEIGKLKRERGMDTLIPEREVEVLSKVQKWAESLGLNPTDAKALFREIIGISRKAQGEINVAYLGPSGSITEEAAFMFFSSIGATFIPCYDIRDVFRKVEAGEAKYGVVPIESSAEGSVAASLDCFLNFDLKICGEVEVPINLCLILHPEARVQDIRVILSHPMALAQVENFLNRHFPNVQRKEVSSTAEAVRLLSSMKHAAAIASKTSAKLYGMKIEAENIQDVKGAFTRFAVLGREDCKPTGNDKTSIVFSVQNAPGALYRALEPFAKYSVNITKIESRPTKKIPWEYVFFMDFEGHREDPICKRAIEEMEQRVTFLRLLGSYPKWS